MNNAAEICAVLERVLVAVQEETILTIFNPKYVIEGLCFHLKCWEDNGWMRVSNSDVWKATVAALRQWRAPIFFQWTKGHNGNEGNKGADALAEKGMQVNEDSATPADIEITHEFDVEGV
ncbi:ribonuclease H-like domain-containing protein [Desarmillaria tabescens]|uniref:Ribonuclease H-like domain-containing protein n=1 Tax=Armillaria tabescens TaxID=1929756 RepID=A0AA39MLI6_ARMTA|nr:ribonuclease H-like domain-containing protein [Desarmillaria tabescens]KAK0439276.1 ribonuclease H-like domain-containing protein [Desarmillaria tabescens]